MRDQRPLVTVHVPPGDTLKQLMAEMTSLMSPDDPALRSVSGRSGVLVGARLAYRYLDRRYGEVTPHPGPTAAAESDSAAETPDAAGEGADLSPPSSDGVSQPPEAVSAPPRPSKPQRPASTVRKTTTGDAEQAPTRPRRPRKTATTGTAEPARQGEVQHA